MWSIYVRAARSSQLPTLSYLGFWHFVSFSIEYLNFINYSRIGVFSTFLLWKQKLQLGCSPRFYCGGKNGRFRILL